MTMQNIKLLMDTLRAWITAGLPNRAVRLCCISGGRRLAKGQSALEYIVILGTLSILTVLSFGPLGMNTAVRDLVGALEGTFQSAVGAMQRD